MLVSKSTRVVAWMENIFFRLCNEMTNGIFDFVYSLKLKEIKVVKYRMLTMINRLKVRSGEKIFFPCDLDDYFGEK
jgi:hypothetical protein